jgi:ketosteroid isomerase-like protein
MEEHPNIARLRRGYAAYATGDTDAIDDLLDDDITWHVPGRSPLAGDYEGKEEVYGFFLKLMELTEGTARLDVHDVLANDTHGVALLRNTATRNGRSHSSNLVHVFHFDDGKVTEFWSHPGDPYGDDELLSS